MALVSNSSVNKFRTLGGSLFHSAAGLADVSATISACSKNNLYQRLLQVCNGWGPALENVQTERSLPVCELHFQERRHKCLDSLKMSSTKGSTDWDIHLCAQVRRWHCLRASLRLLLFPSFLLRWMNALWLQTEPCVEMSALWESEPSDYPPQLA